MAVTDRCTWYPPKGIQREPLDCNFATVVPDAGAKSEPQ